jgi:hypothetical protein
MGGVVFLALEDGCMDGSCSCMDTMEDVAKVELVLRWLLDF